MSGRRRPIAFAVAVLAVVAVVVLTGCGLHPGDRPNRIAQEVTKGPARGAYFGSDRDPGPSSLWVDAAGTIGTPTTRRLNRLNSRSNPR